MRTRSPLYKFIKRPTSPSVGFPGSLAGKESICNAGDTGSIPGSGRSPGDGMGCPLQYSWASLVAQMVKNLPAVWETWIWSLGWEDTLEKGVATHSSVLAWRIPMDRGALWVTVHRGHKDSGITEWLSTAQDNSGRTVIFWKTINLSMIPLIYFGFYVLENTWNNPRITLRLWFVYQT